MHFHAVGGFMGRPVEVTVIIWLHRPRCHGNKNLQISTQNGYNSGCIRHNLHSCTGYEVFRVGTFKGVRQICSDYPCCNGNDKYKPILNDSALVNISERDKAIDFKCGTQLQTYNTQKVTISPQKRRA